MGTDDWPGLISLAVHELRTPANVLQGSLRMLTSGRVGHLDESAARLLAQAARQSDRLAALIEDLGQLARLASARAPFNRGPVDIDTLADDVAREFVAPPDAELSLQRDGSTRGATVTADPVRLRRALAGVLAAIAREAPARSALALRTGCDPACGEVTISVGLAVDLDATARPGVRLEPFEDLRGGLGLEPPLAQLVIAAEGGRIEQADTSKRPHPVIIRLPLAR